MQTIKRTEAILSNDPKCRNSDKLLLLKFWHTQGLILTPEQRQIFLDKCSTAESITRARRALREKYPESPKIEEERFNKFLQYKNNHAVSWL